MTNLHKTITSLALAICLFIVTIQAPGDHVISDPSATLITAESLIRHGTVNLNRYPRSALEQRGPYQIVARGKKLADAAEGEPIFYYYPPGTPVSSIPAVWIANQSGLDFLNFNNERMVQIAMACSIFAANFLMLVLNGTWICGFLPALALALSWCLGSSLLSTGTRALWSHDFSIFYALLTITILHWLERKQRLTNNPKQQLTVQQVSAFMAGVFSVAAVACRPGMILFAAISLSYILYTRSIRRKTLAPYIAGQSALLVSFFIFSLAQYGSLLPPYYTQSLASNSIFDAIGAITGLLFSPSRGLFIFTSLSLFYTLLSVWIWRKEGFQNWMIFSVIWPLIQILLLSRWPLWWGGYSYGPRLQMDILPGLAFGSFFVERRMQILARLFQGRPSTPLTWLLCGAICFSIFVHSQSLIGARNHWLNQWNSEPHVDSCTGTIWDWRYPQFFHSEVRHQLRLQEFKSGIYPCKT